VGLAKNIKTTSLKGKGLGARKDTGGTAEGGGCGGG